MKPHRPAILAAALGCGVIVPHAPASGADFEIVKLAVSGDPVAGGGTVTSILDYDIDRDDVVFTITGGPASRGVFRSVGGIISPIATNATPVPGGAGAFASFDSPTVADGEVAFRGVISGGGTGIYVTRNGSLTRVVDLATSIPGGSGTFTNLQFGAPNSFPADNDARGINSGFSNGNVVFAGRGSNGQAGTYFAGSDGTLRRIADQTTAITSGNLGSIEGDSVVFVGNAGQGLGLYRYSVSAQLVTPIAAANTVFTGGVRPNLDSTPAISGDAVAFNVETSTVTYAGIYVADSAGARLIADGTTPAPGSNGTFVVGSAPNALGASGVTLSEGNVAFTSTRTSGGSGLYTTLGGELQEVISTDDTIGGRAVLGFLNTPAAVVVPPKISGSNIVFGVAHGGGASGLYVALAEHHWRAASGGAWDTAANWSFDLGPRNVLPTFVDPVNGGIITGPAGATAVKALQIGARESGIAELRMQASGQINVAGAVTITPRGRLEAAGVLSALGGVDNSGVISAAETAQISGGLNNRAGGEVRVGAGKRLTLAGTTSSNAGTIEVTGGELEFTGALTNLPSTGIITARDATLRFGQLTNPGAIALVAGTTDIHGDIANTGSIVVSGGTGGALHTAIFHDDVVQNGTLTVSATGSTRSAAVFLGGFSGAGGITGGGDVFFEGDLRPGNSPAAVTYTANVSLAANATLTMELGGRVAGTEYDRLTVNGDLTLGGTLAVTLLGGFTPEWGDTFDLFDFDPVRRSGAWAAVELPTLEGGLSWDASEIAESGVLSVVPEPGSAALLLVGAGALLIRTRREKRGEERDLLGGGGAGGVAEGD